MTKIYHMNKRRKAREFYSGNKQNSNSGRAERCLGIPLGYNICRYRFKLFLRTITFYGIASRKAKC